MSNSRRRMTFDQNFKMRNILVEKYGGTLRLDKTGAKVAKEIGEMLGCEIAANSIGKACADLGIKPRVEKKTRVALADRVAILEAQLSKIMDDLGIAW